MDNFLDRIAQKLNASSETAKNNVSAEEAEARRHRAKVNEYDKLLAEMRQINLHNAELCAKMNATFAQLSALVNEMKLQTAPPVVSAGVSDLLSEELRTEIIDVIIKNGAMALEKSTEHLIEMSGEMSMWLQESQRRSEDTVMRLQQTGEFTENIIAKSSEFLSKNQEVANTIQAASERVNELLSDISKVGIDNLSYTQKIGEQLIRYDAQLDRSEQSNNRSAEIADRLTQTLTDAQSDNDRIFASLEKISEETRALGEKSIDTSSMSDDISAKLGGIFNDQTAAVNELSSKIEDFVHKENVKVYRNVQAVVEESIKQHGEAVDGSLSAIKQDVKSNKIYLVFAVIFSLGSLGCGVFSILRFLGII